MDINISFILRSLSTSDICPKIVDLDFNEVPIERALGIIWDTKSDLLKVKAVSKTFPCTRTELLSCVSSIFDPLGIVNSSVLEAKLQELWRRNTRWDTERANDLKKRLNPADDSTRPVEFKELHQNCRWFNGPEFVKQNLFEWPVEKETCPGK